MAILFADEPIFMCRPSWLKKDLNAPTQVTQRSMTEESVKIPALTPEQQKQLVDEAIERLDRLADSQLEMARLFIDRGKPEIANRRLKEIVELYGKSEAAKEAKKLMKGL